MSSLFVANTSNKHNEFTFRLPGNPQLRTVYIPPGKQMEVLRNAQREEIDSVIEQHSVYGMVAANNAKNICKFAGTLYSIDKPVAVDNMHIAMEANNDILLQEGYELRKIAAVATDATISDAIAHSSEKVGKQTNIEMSVQELEDERTGNKKLMAETIKVSRKKAK
jgi:hypothetical protein